MARRFPFAASLVASLAAAAPAHAVISSPPAAPHEVTVFPERDFVVVDGWPSNKDFKLEVLRNGVVVGSALGTTDADGLAEVNHPGGFCWTGFTPDILPGDVLQATEIGAPTVGDATRTAGVSAEQATVVGSQLVVHGRAVSATGGPIPLGNLEQRIIEPALVGLVGRRDVRAPGGGNGFSSTLSYDPVGPANPDGTRWTARYTGMSGAAMDTAAGGETRILTWMTANAAGDRFGITIFEAGVTGGPGFGGCPAAASNAVTAPGSLNAAALAPGAADVVFAGAAQPDATAVSLKISDGTTTIDVPATAVTLAGGAWTASVPAAQLAALADGTLTVAGAYTVPGGTVTGSELSVVKDTVAPDAPASTPAPGTYDSAQSLSLASADPTAEIHYTVDGSDPTPTSRTAAGQVRVTSTQTLKAIAVDPAGNASGVSTLDYVITPQAPTVITLPAPILQPQSLAKLALGRLTLRHKVSRADLRRRGLRAGLSLPEGTEVLRVRLYRTGPRKLLTSFWRFPTSDGEYRLIVRSKMATRLGRGKYVLELTPGRSKRSLGTAHQVTFQVR